jgi:prepilin-type processing-associated H-X9-DG protein
MKPRPTSPGRKNRPRRGFTLTDLLVAVACVSVLGALLLAQQTRARTKVRLNLCTSNLAQVSHATLDYANDHQQRLPAGDGTDKHDIWWWYKEMVKPYAGLHGESSDQDTLFACPEDRGYSDRTPFHQNGRFDFSSYVFNGVTLPGMPNLSGLSITDVNHPRRTLLVMEWTAHAPLSWHASQTGRRNAPFYCDAKSVVGFVDGHVSFIPIYFDGYNAAYTQDPISSYDYQYSAN